MDLIYTCYSQSERRDGIWDSHRNRSEGDYPSSHRWNPYLGAGSSPNLSAISPQNVLVFTTTANHPTGSGNLDSTRTNSVCDLRLQVFVCDLNTPWDLHCIAGASRTNGADITALAWNEDGEHFVLADSDGKVEIWQMNDGIVSSWKCIARETIEKETYIEAKFVAKRRRVYLNNEKMESPQYSEKFVHLPPSGAAHSSIGYKTQLAVVLVSQTALVTMITVNPVESTTTTGQQSAPTVTKSVSSVLGIRCRVKHASMTYLKDGKLVVAYSNGSPSYPVRTFSLLPGLKDQGDRGELTLKVQELPSIHIQCQSKQGSAEDVCKSIVDLCFIKGDDCDAILVATQTPAGGRVELWELKELTQTIHKMFMHNENGGPKITTTIWHYVEVFSGPASQVASVSTPLASLQTEPGSPCYITVAYEDGSIQCLLKDALQQISSVDLPKAGNLWNESSPSKIPRNANVNICSMAFTATGNALVALDSLGQLYLYRMTPISDPGGPHTVPYLVTMFEYCLVAGIDFWDLTLCTKATHIDQLCEKLTENFEFQPRSVQNYYYNRYMAIKMSLFRLSISTEQRASDCYISIVLFSIKGMFASLLRSAESWNIINDKSVTLYDKVLKFLEAKKDEPDIEKLLQMLQSAQKDFVVDGATLTSYQHLIQWVTNFILHMMASIPEYKQMRRGPGFDLYNDIKILTTLRELLLFIRIWGNLKEGVKPTFTKTVDSFDVIAKLFSLVTRQRENPNDETLQEDCLRLPSQVMLPHLNANIRARGVSSPSAAVTHTRSPPLTYEFGVEPDSEIVSQSEVSVFVEGAMTTNQVIDCVRQTYMGKKPHAALQSTRCFAMTLPPTTAGTKSWEKQWLRHCQWAGNWKLKHFEK